MLFRASTYIGALVTAILRAPGATGVIALVSWLVPFSVQFVLHPSDLIHFVRLIAPWPNVTLMYGELAAIAVLVALALIMLWAVVLFYRAAGIPIPLWPLIAFGMIALIGNSGWWVGRGFFDVSGALAGLAPTALLYFCETKALLIAFRPGYRGAGDAMFG
jgi:hypothetical protein